MTKKSLGVVRDRIKRRAHQARLELSDELVERLCTYVELLRRWNERMNLTALDDLERGLDRLIVEPLMAVERLPTQRGRLVDIGSGGGSPAIPMKLAAPGVDLLMVEAKARKAAFLREVCRQLELDGTVVETCRYESLLTRTDLHEAHDVLTLRAVRVDGPLLLGLQAFVKPGGQLFLFRGGGASDLPDEIRPPLVWRATHPLVSTLRSRLVVLEKWRAGAMAKKKRT